MNKSAVRKQITAFRPDAQTLKQRSERVIEQLRSIERVQSAGAMGLYMPLPDEVDVSPLLDRVEKTTFLPAFDTKMGLYRMAEYTGELQAGKFGILEPARPRFANEHELDLIVVPGVAFDRSGGRIGRGGGFYDRLLPLYSAFRLGICFEFQYLEHIPTEPHDFSMQGVVMESDFIEY